MLEVSSLPCHLTYLLANLDYSVIGVDVAPERAQTPPLKGLKVVKAS